VTARRCTAAALLAAMLVPALAAPALAVQDPVTGYWTRTRVGAPLPVEPPTTVPEGGSWVSGDPVGPVAVSAIRALADDGSVIAGFRLTVDEVVGTPAIVVCPTTERWAPEQGGRLEGAPTADCTAAVQTTLQDDVLLVALPTAMQLDVVDVLLTPEPGSAFSATFQRATAASVVQAPAAPPPPVTAPPPAPVAPPPSGGSTFAPPPAFDGGFAGGTGFGTPDLGAPALASQPLLPAPELPPPAAAQGPQPQAAPPVVLARPAAVVPVDRTASLMAVALLVGLVALALRLAVQPAAAPRHLGGGARLSRAAAPAAAVQAAAPAATPARGVGRFRSARLRPPVRI
jgi:hypothetical protein